MYSIYLLFFLKTFFCIPIFWHSNVYTVVKKSFTKSDYFFTAVKFCANYIGDAGSKPESSVTTISLDAGDGSPLVVEALDLSNGSEHCINHTYSASCDCKATVLIKNDVSNFTVENIQVRTVNGTFALTETNIDTDK